MQLPMSLQSLSGGLYAPALKKILFDSMQQRYAQHEPVIDRILQTVQTPQDYEAFGQFFVSLFEAGFMRSVDQHKAILEKHGFQVSITSEPEKPKKSTNPIFSQNAG